jgi:hypothetical protein
MYDQAVDGLMLLSDVDITMAAGGYQPNMPGEGGGGPSLAESRIEKIFEGWDAGLAGGSDEWTSYMTDDAMFHDSDQNGFFDHLEIAGDGGVWLYDGVADSWTFKAYKTNQAS